MTMYELKMWKAKLSCPVCGKIEKNEDWYVGQHMLQEHSKEQIMDGLLDGMIRTMEHGKAWLINEA